MTKRIVESILDKKPDIAEIQNEILIRIGNRVDEMRQKALSMLLLGEESTHDWFRSLSSEQQKSYLTMHPKSELRKYYKVTADGKVVTADEKEKAAPQKLKPPKEEKKIDKVKAPDGYTGKKQEPKVTTKPEDEAPSKEKSDKNPEEISLSDLRAKQKVANDDYDKTPAKEVKGQSAQDILAKSGSPTDMNGPDAESGKEGSDAEFERELIAGLSNLAQEVKDYKTRKKEAETSGKEFSEEPPKFELCQITVPGTNLFCQNNIGVPRDDMPQLSGSAREGSPAASLQKAADGSVSIEKQYAERVAKDGIKTKPRKVDVATLKATQTNLGGEKIAGMLETLKVDPKNEALNAPIYVSKDGYILDGHHRWAALLSLGIADGLDEPVAMNVVEVDMEIQDLLDYTNKFADEMGIEKKKAGETTGENDKKPIKESVEKKMDAKDFVNMVRSSEGVYINPINPREFYYVFGEDIVLMEMYSFGGNAHISSIMTSGNRRKGYATEVMNKIIKMADEHGVTLGLSPSPFGTEKTTKAVLVKWYKKLGFNYRKGDSSYMIRKPQN